ncbi:hypothetical protein AT959_17360 [Dechloromonas denitrificans]|uniref:Diguanylate cyclase n=1 Tax=Dechloromonas denitrificans TaxID=281362 RepID=A0A133XFM5_9RHOO|nr:GGDEF and EAL domain-containing protein [Dechloromonas denitrificans]KXB29699.1 hypothetical protein AT959_17360 [Dechloromonas denitrificans]
MALDSAMGLPELSVAGSDLRPHEVEQLQDGRIQVADDSLLCRWDYDPQARRFHFDAMAGRLFGWRADERQPSLDQLASRVASDERPALIARFANRGGGSPLPGHPLHVWNAELGCWIVVKVFAYAQSLAGGPRFVLKGFCLDITRQQESEETLRRYRTLLAAPSSLGHMWYWSINYADGHYETSDNSLLLLGWPDGTSRIPEAEFRARIHPEDLPHIIARRQSALRDDKPTEIDYRFWQIAQQRWIFLRSLFFFVRDPAGSPVTLYGFTQDITRHKEAEAALAKERQRIESAQVLGRMGTWSFDIGRRVVRVSRSTLNMLGHDSPGDALMGEEESLANLHPDDRQSVLKAINRSCLTFEPFSMEYRRWHYRENRWVHLKSSAHVVRDADGVPYEVQGFTQDITRQKENEQHLRFAASVFEHGRSLIVITDIERRIIQVNPAFCELTGFSADEVIGRRPGELIRTPVAADCRPGNFWFPLLRAGHWSGELPCRHKNGEPFTLAVNFSAVRNESGEIGHFICVGDDVTQQKAAERQINHLAYFDPLTQLPNRVRFKEQVDLAIRQASRDGHELALLFLDLDYFKHVNDSLGHSAGDQLLVEVAGRLRAAVRASDTVGRLGGDEFMVLLPIGGHQAARCVADKLIEALGQPFQIDAMALTVTSSIGISLFPRDGDHYDALLRAADAAMYKAKDAGRNTFLDFVPEMNDMALKRLTLSNELRQALPRRELLLHYQPQVALDDGRLIGVEALLRWQHPEWGMISPAEFIPVAEESGLIEAIGAWVIEEACQQAVAWDQLGLPELSMSINCSTRQFLEPQALLDTVRTALRRSGLPPARLELEITETLIVQDIAKTQWLLEQFRALGVRIAIDDFGTGYSSLYYLKRLPIDKLKIDQSFVRDLVANPDDRTIAATVATLGHSLGLRVIAEGVETAEQLQILETMQCDEGQGYLWSRPLPAGQFIAWYRGTYGAPERAGLPQVGARLRQRHYGRTD